MCFVTIVGVVYRIIPRAMKFSAITGRLPFRSNAERIHSNIDFFVYVEKIPSR